MLVRTRRGWELPESAATPEVLVVGRRKGLGLIGGSLAAGLGLLHGGPVFAQGGAAPGGLTPDPRFDPGRATTPERNATTYNNYYEFGDSKDVVSAARKLKMTPWSIRFEGMVAQPREIGLEDLLKQVRMEERVLRHRCVETWAMTVPWTGFPLSEFVRLAQPTSGAKYLVLETAQQPDVMPGLRQIWYSWPYIEGCTLAEAQNELGFVATGMYGKPLPPQNGGPIRVLFPWKYGFKSGKSVVKVTFTDKRPVSFWEQLQSSEYGFWANVNPEVPHPRWSQATERLLGSNERVPTRIFNGYGEFVADLYKGLEGERLYT
ncbi:Molybdopterin dependent oxidoreductase [Roseomonas mucosa]|uniref:protein-methionine-sulfoxide reductase catalytic subunit MsrP n=1 Tax=Roseomonas TaxID=125216 RepID=UPI000968DCD6|nr:MULTISPECIES: protein-methionine-sulfoxide reductase catalytic subunit MsrP [Roseomonas]ATR20398.1 protein-methionine-sulfoxide reductase catalytic subunit MsrP [Roseomonas sp. FDAARGOS_362]USQ71526.1 protein-methionine-sulfoxide reductase catalytic subunit MsrP [Roseomonas mucosa]UZO97373.1 Molybdopterin dependent oxidoreductase [Roseomonas mucosa]GAV34554.1 sulfoxide reductase catalytic subunit YedY precursor [Roseomonas sp. TAS13]